MVYQISSKAVTPISGRQAAQQTNIGNKYGA
jgi:hypothetical protein